MSKIDMVKEFHEAFNIEIDVPLNKFNLALRETLVTEEYEELEDEMTRPKYRGGIEKENLLKEMADLLYVVYGTAVTYGWDLDEAFRRVHESNMSKLGKDGKPVYRKDGKVIKGPYYKPPDLSDLV